MHSWSSSTYELITMGALCEEAISGAAKALLERRFRALRETVLATERDIDQKERDIESLCLKLLLQQQPVARDLRHDLLRAEDDLRHGAHRRPGRRHR